MAQAIQSLIASSVNQVIRDVYPETYNSLCHVYAIVGANLISIMLGRVYRPVAGLALIDCGHGSFIEMTDNSAFAHPAGGAFHCWIESVDEAVAEKEVVDLTFRHNKEYAHKIRLRWRRPDPPDYLWGPYSKIVVQASLDAMLPGFAEGKVWLQETDEGWDWMTRHLANNLNAYVALTAAALKLMQRTLPSGSTVLAPALAPTARATTDSAPASAPAPPC